jgi:hypothetical protein
VSELRETFEGVGGHDGTLLRMEPINSKLVTGVGVERMEGRSMAITVPFISKASSFLPASFCTPHRESTSRRRLGLSFCLVWSGSLVVL